MWVGGGEVFVSAWSLNELFLNLRSILLEFFELCGIDFNYCLVCIVVPNGGYYSKSRSEKKILGEGETVHAGT